MEKLTFVIPTLFGLEGIAADELRRMGLPDVQAENGRVLCGGTAADLPRINYGLRTGERVMILLGRFPAPTFDALFEGVRALPLERLIPKGGQFPVKGHSLQSALTSIPACQSIIKKAAAARLGAKYGVQTLPETGSLYQLRFAIMKDEAAIMLDTSGPGLYKRGYRAQGVDAPLRETLAAALVLLSRYRGRDPFRDPFCGSGTIPIEAALIAKNRAPGLGRTFPCMQWPLLPKPMWTAAADEARGCEFSGSYDILGSDIDPRAVALSAANAKKAGVEDIVRFAEADATAFRAEGEFGRVVTNPPYGERIMERQEAEGLYRAFGAAWARTPPRWSLALLSSHTEFERTFGKTADKKRKLYNGMLKCDLFFYSAQRRTEGHDPSLHHQSNRRENGPKR